MTAGNGRSEILELKENIFQLGGSRSPAGAKVYLVRGARKNLLIDSGLPSDSDLLREQLSSLGLSVDDIHIVVLTHEHMDHIGGVPSFPPKTVVAAHAMAANKIGLQDEFVLMTRAFGHRLDDFHVDIHLHHGTTIDVGGCALRTIHTPGHCSGAICLYEPENGILFTGDTVFAGGTLGGIFPSGNISDYIGTLQALRNMKIRELYPGHGRISTDAEGDLDRAIRASINLMGDTRSLFDALNAQAEFRQIMKSIATYSRRV